MGMGADFHLLLLSYVALVSATGSVSVPQGMIAWFREKDIGLASTATTWASSEGSFTATITGPNAVETSAAGANAFARSVRYISGNPSTQVNFGNILTGSVWTICTLTRYTGASQGRIINDIGSNFLHGHWSGNVGVAHYNTWRTPDATGGSNNWIAFCGQNGGENLMTNNGVNVGVAAGGSTSGNIAINPSEASDFGVAEVMTWSRHTP